MFAAGPVPVYSANVPRLSNTLLPHSLPFQPLMLVLMSSTLTLSDHFQNHEDAEAVAQWLHLSLWCPVHYCH